MSPEVDYTPMDVEGTTLPRNRPSLYQTLAAKPSGTFVHDASMSDSNALGTPSQLATAKNNAASKPPFHQGSTSSAFVSSASNPNSSMHASSSSSYGSSNPAPNIVDQPVSDVQPIRSPGRLPVPPPIRRYDSLRQIQSRLQAALPKIGSPNLTSAMLLVESAQQRTDRLYNEARQLHNFCQDMMQRAQQGQAAALHLIEAAEEARGVADGAKAELDRILSKEAVQQRNADANEVRGLIQAVDDWIRNQEAAEAEIRAKKIQQLKLKKQKTASQTPLVPSGHPSVAAQSPLSGSTAALLSANNPTSKQPLFFSPTPEVDVKMEQTGPQLQQSSPVDMPSAEQLRKRQADLRKKLQEKRRSAEAESRAASPSNITPSGRQRSEEEKKKIEDELKRREDERKKEAIKREEIERLQEERRREEQARKDMVAKREAEKAREEEARKQKEAEEAERMRRTEEEKAARQAAQKEMEDRAREKAETERKAKEDAKARAAQAAEERKQAVAFLNQQKETNDKLRQVPAELRRRQSQEAQDKQRKLAEEQARMRAEREREDKLRQEQERRRQQIQVEKNKTMADRAQQIWAQRGHRLIPSQETTSEMSLDSSPHATTIFLAEGSPPQVEPWVPPSRNPNSQLGPNIPHLGVKNQPLSTGQPSTTGQKSVDSCGPVTPTPRQISLPPVAHLSPTDSTSSLPRSVPLSQPAMSVYRHSSDHGNVPYRDNLTTSPQAQAANLKPLLHALNLPTINAVKVKFEPVPDSLTLSYPSEPFDGGASVQSSTSQAHNIGQQPTAARRPPPHNPSPITSNPSQFAKPMNGSPTNVVVDKPITSSVIEATVRDRAPQHVSKPSSNLSNITNNQPAPRDEALQLAPSNHARSESPFRMGPDPLESRPIQDEMSPVEDAYNKFSPQYPVSSAPVATSSPPYRGRLPASNSAPTRWDSYPIALPAPKGANVYRPNYRERSRSPATRMKRARSPGATSTMRDYREYGERSVPIRRISRSPPRRPRRLSRSPSPFYAQDRPPLYARIDDTYRPPEHRDSYSSRPELLNRFTEPRTVVVPPPGKPGRGRGKRGKGVPPAGFTHASLEQRISNTTLMSRLEDPPRRS